MACLQQAQAQVTRTWDRGAVTDVITAASNWNPDGAPATGDTLVWDGTVAGNLTLTFSSTVGGGASVSGLNLNLTSNQTANLTIDNSSASPAVFRLKDISVASGAGAFTFGNGSGGTNRLILQVATNTTHTLANNSATTATLSSDVSVENTGDTNQHLLFTGDGNWRVNGAIIRSGILANSNLTKEGSGTLFLNGNNTYTGTTTITAGTLAGTGSLGNGNTTVTGGNIAAGTDGTVGVLTFNNGLNLSGLTGNLKFDLGSTVASDKLLVTTGALSIGSGLLNFDDFNFTALSGFGTGTYTLFDTSTSISGTLGSSLAGTIGGLNAFLSQSNDSQDILLTVSAVIPEPSTYAAFVGVLALAFALNRNRGRKAV